MLLMYCTYPRIVFALSPRHTYIIYNILHCFSFQDDSHPCSQTYEGPEPFSEPESRAVRDAVLKVAHRIQVRGEMRGHSLPWVPQPSAFHGTVQDVTLRTGKACYFA